MPATIFIKVDLPAPFSPISAWTVPRLSLKETSSSATTPGNSLRTLSTVSRYSELGTAPLCRTAAIVVGLIITSPPPKPAGLPGRDRRVQASRDQFLD